MAKLDRKREFGTITGDDQGRLYEQDHLFFAADGSEWEDPAKADAKAELGDKPASKARAAKADAKADDQLSAQLS